MKITVPENARKKIKEYSQSLIDGKRYVFIAQKVINYEYDNAKYGGNADMKRYIALLRGINISGKNKIVMSELKECFSELGFTDIVTCLNSGNVIFSNSVEGKRILANKIKLMIKSRFDLEIPVFIVLQEELAEVLNHAPDWWGNDDKEIYDNLIFLAPTLVYKEFYEEIGEPKEEYERVVNYKNVVFWSFNRKDYQKTNWWSKTASSKIGGQITIRTANTVRKIVAV